MSTKTMKILTFIATILLVISLGTSTIFALTPSQVQPTDPGTNDIQTLGGKILGILQTVGIVLSVIILVILGIKYMMGSAEEKAEYKKTILMYCLGAAIVFTGSTLPNIIYKLATGLF